VADIEHNEVSYKIVKSLLALTHDMQLACVVEGVETPQHLQRLRELGATHGQGYLFAMPLASDQVQAWLQSRRPSRLPGQPHCNQCRASKSMPLAR
jgi:EAL domain-containing protein (putative c-di-GMP-specific phosphodiesterase class I)